MKDEIAQRAAAYAIARANTNAAKAHVELARRVLQKAVELSNRANEQESAAAEALLATAGETA